MDVYAVNLLDFLNTYHKEDINNISLIKIDAEGHDNEILKTIIPLINSVKPAIITEMYSGLTKDEIHALLDTIHKLNYEVYDIGNVNEGLSSNAKRKLISNSIDIKSGVHGNLLCLPIK